MSGDHSKPSEYWPHTLALLDLLASIAGSIVPRDVSGFTQHRGLAGFFRPPEGKGLPAPKKVLTSFTYEVGTDVMPNPFK